MRVGDLVRWSKVWIVGCSNDNPERLEKYKQQIGIIIQPSEGLSSCWFVSWDDGVSCDVHYDYLEVI